MGFCKVFKVLISEYLRLAFIMDFFKFHNGSVSFAKITTNSDQHQLLAIFHDVMLKLFFCINYLAG